MAVSREFVWKIEADRTKPSEDVHLDLVRRLFVWLRSLPGGFSLQVGRQRFEDERQWLYDEELDAVRLRFRRGALALELSLSQDGLVREGPAAARGRAGSDQQLRAATRPTILWKTSTLEAYAIVRDDQTAPERRRPVFVGLRSRGEPVEDLDYWLELGYVGGGTARRGSTDGASTSAPPTSSRSPRSPR